MAIEQYMPKIHDLDVTHQDSTFHVGTLREQHKQFTYLKPKAVVGYWASVSSFFESLTTLQWKPGGGPRGGAFSSSDSRGDSSFNAFGSLAEAIDVFTNDPKRVRDFTAEDIVLKSDESIGKDVAYDVTGDFLDMGLFLEGQPECFGNAYNGNPTGLHVTVYVDIVANAHINNKTILHKQKRVLRFVDWLEQQGVRCKVLAVWSNVCGHFEWAIKDYGDPVDLNAVAISMHPEFMRRLAFLACEQSETITFGYGETQSWTRAMQSTYQADPADGLTVFVSCQMKDNTEWVDRQFDRLRDKVEALLTGEGKDSVAGEETMQRDFTKVYAVQL
jgi:hypothetical protein